MGIEAEANLSEIHRWIKRNHPDGFIDSQTYWQNLERVRENWYDRYDRLEVDACRFVRERDEAIRQLENIKASSIHTCHDQCQRPMCVLRRERDEARAAIPDGEWVAYEDHKKVHDAASRLLVAINKQLPIGSFSLISHEYHALIDAIYGKEGAK
jgi:hypothetical protein